MFGKTRSESDPNHDRRRLVGEVIRFLRFQVIINRIGDRLYVPSVYRERGEFPDERFWNRNVVRDPRVRLQIGERIYERSAVLVEDPAEWRAVLDAFMRKSPFWKDLAARPEAERPRFHFLRMDPRPDAA